MTTETGSLVGNRPLRMKKALLHNIALVTPCVSSNLDDAARHKVQCLTATIERKTNKDRGWFPSIYSSFSLPTTVCGEAGP